MEHLYRGHEHLECFTNEDVTIGSWLMGVSRVLYRRAATRGMAPGGGEMRDAQGGPSPSPGPGPGPGPGGAGGDEVGANWFSPGWRFAAFCRLVYRSTYLGSVVYS